MSSTTKRSRGNTGKCLQDRFNKCTLHSVCKISKEVPIKFANFLVKYYFMDNYFIIR